MGYTLSLNVFRVWFCTSVFQQDKFQYENMGNNVVDSVVVQYLIT